MALSRGDKILVGVGATGAAVATGVYLVHRLRQSTAQATQQALQGISLTPGIPSPVLSKGVTPSAGGVIAATLAAHNQVRAAVGSPPLTWDANLASVAQDWANHLCATGALEHRPNNPYGENIFLQTGGSAPGVEVAVASWAAERQYYNAQTNACQGGECGHFTQLVWRGSLRVGCGFAQCGGRYYWVCNYDPPGNYIGERPY